MDIKTDIGTEESSAHVFSKLNPPAGEYALRFLATHFSQKERLLPFRQVKERTLIGKTTWYDMMKKGEAPLPIKLGRQRVAWLESEIIAFLNARILERSQKGGD